MSKLLELNEARAKARDYVNMLSMSNVAFEPEARLAQSAQYQLAMDALERAEREYRVELANTSTDALNAIAFPSHP